MRIGIFAACLASLALAACATTAPPGAAPATIAEAVATGLGAPASPAAIADTFTADERTAIAVQTSYAAGAEALALAFRTGYVPTTRDPNAKRPDWCARVSAGQVTPADTGARLMALDCRARAAALRVRSLYGVTNKADWVSATLAANGLVRQLIADIRAARR